MKNSWAGRKTVNNQSINQSFFSKFPLSLDYFTPLLLEYYICQLQIFLSSLFVFIISHEWLTSFLNFPFNYDISLNFFLCTHSKTTSSHSLTVIYTLLLVSLSFGSANWVLHISQSHTSFSLSACLPRAWCFESQKRLVSCSFILNL
jgi:hypothetical protein